MRISPRAKYVGCSATVEVGGRLPKQIDSYHLFDSLASLCLRKTCSLEV